VHPHAIRFAGVSKAFRGASGVRSVLDGVSLELDPGEIVALRGPNGAGKTTLLRLAAGLLLPDAGSVEITGAPAGSGAARRVLGFAAADDRGLYPRLTARQNLHYYAALYGVREAVARRCIEELVGALALAEALDLRVDRASGGMRAATSLARALVHRPAVVLLDEPTHELDADRTRRVLALLRQLAARGTAVLLATHSAQAIEVSARVVRLDRGRIDHGAVPTATA
jgi:ABC-2 type transport system ATP-binding protein